MVISTRAAVYPVSSVVARLSNGAPSPHKRPSIAWALNHSDRYTLGRWDSARGQFQALGKWVDDYGYSAPGGCRNAKLWALGHEFGYSHLVHADSLESAYSAHLDESQTIAEGELPNAYGFYLMQACKWHETNSQAPWYICCDGNFHGEEIGELVSENVLKCTGDRRCIGGAFASKELAWAYAMEYIQENELELIEGYEHQSNSSGTGIVETGHYGHYTEVQWAELLALPKALGY